MYSNSCSSAAQSQVVSYLVKSNLCSSGRDMRTAYQYTITLPAMFLAPLALAHEGHGYTSAGSIFHLVEPIHLLPIAVILIAPATT